MNILSLVISIIALLVTVYNCYRQYFMKKEGIILTISDALIEGDRLKVLLLYTNIGNQTATITNASIQLDSDKLNFGTRANHSAVCNWIQPFTLFEKDQKCITVDYPLPDFKDSDINKVSIRILSFYTNRKGVLFRDHYPVGHLHSNNRVRCVVNVTNDAHKLSGDRLLETIQ